jgi:hypothetical protein
MAKAKTLAEAQARKVRAEVDRLNARTDGIEDVTRLLVKVQRDSLAKAERLRKLAVAVVESRDCTRPRQYLRAVNALEAFVGTLPPFHTPPKGPVPNLPRRRARPS